MLRSTPCVPDDPDWLTVIFLMSIWTLISGASVGWRNIRCAPTLPFTIAATIASHNLVWNRTILPKRLQLRDNVMAASASACFWVPAPLASWTPNLPIGSATRKPAHCPQVSIMRVHIVAIRWLIMCNVCLTSPDRPWSFRPLALHPVSYTHLRAHETRH